jgi:hypothetical protein
MLRHSVSPAGILILAMLFSACPHRPLDLGKDGAPTSAEDLLKRVEFAEAQVTSINGDAKLVIDSPQGKGAVDLFLAVAQPASLHIEQLDFFGRPQAVMMTDGTAFGLFQDGRFMRGPATPENLSRLLPVVIPPQELAAVLLGRAPRIAHESLAMRFDDRTQHFVLTLKRGAAVQTLEISPPSYRVVHSSAQGFDAYEINFSDITEQNGVMLVKSVTLTAASAKTKLELTLKTVTLNEEPDPSMFVPEAPPDVPVVDVK